MNVVKVQIFVLMWVGLLVAAASGERWTAGGCALLHVSWSAARGDHTYRLRGRYSVASLSGDRVTSVSSDAHPGGEDAELCVPEGLYRVTLEPGYTLERLAGEPADALPGPAPDGAVEVVPALLVSPNPVVVTATEGGVAAMGLSLVDMPGTTPDVEATCMNGS